MYKTIEKNQKLEDLQTEEILELINPTYQLNEYGGLKIKTRIVEVTPKLASILLDRNKKNRPISKENVKYLTKEIENNKWQFGGESIKIDYDGNLIDGQHRLSAVIKSNKSIHILVITGLSPEVFTILDTGRKRNGGDALGINGVSNSRLMSSVVKLVTQFVNGVYGDIGSTSRKLSNQDIVDYVDENPELSESITYANKVYKRCNKLIAPSIIGSLHFLFSKKSKEDADFYMTRLCDGENLTSTSPIMAVRNKLIGAKLNDKHKLTQTEKVKTIILGWNKYREGEQAKTIRISPEKQISIL